MGLTGSYCPYCDAPVDYEVTMDDHGKETTCWKCGKTLIIYYEESEKQTFIGVCTPEKWKEFLTEEKGT